MTFESFTGTIKSGWCSKLGAHFKTWRRRWFLLTLHDLTYQTSPTGRVKGTIPLQTAIVYRDPKCSKQPAFAVRIDKTDRVWQIVTDTPSEADVWVRKIKEVAISVHVKPAISDFKLLKLLGQGAYGKVFLVRFTRTGQIFAMKSLSKRKLVEFDLVGRTEAERNVLMRANHPFIVSARWSLQTEKKVFLVMDYVQGGELFQRLSVEGRFTEARTRMYAAELVLAVDYLHEIGVIHRDLKPENILVDVGGHLKITDFGLVKEKMTAAATTQTFCGTPEYIAPELISAKPYNHMCDWWSLGILIYEMLFSRPPFSDANTNALYRRILDGKIEFGREASPEAQSVILGLCERVPERRLGAKGVGEIKNHAFFNGVVWESVLQKTIAMEWVPELADETDTSMFDQEWTSQQAELSDDDAPADDKAKHIQNFSLMKPKAG